MTDVISYSMTTLKVVHVTRKRKVIKRTSIIFSEIPFYYINTT